MGSVANLLDFVIGETVRITVNARKRGGLVFLESPATATMKINIAASVDDDPFATFDSAPEVTLTDESISQFTIALPAATIPLVLEGVTYRYDVYTTSAGGDVIHQKGGALKLKSAA